MNRSPCDSGWKRVGPRATGQYNTPASAHLFCNMLTSRQLFACATLYFTALLFLHQTLTYSVGSGTQASTLVLFEKASTHFMIFFFFMNASAVPFSHSPSVSPHMHTLSHTHAHKPTQFYLHPIPIPMLTEMTVETTPELVGRQPPFCPCHSNVFT